ncbi:hypothetical protein ACHAW5_010018 [Stephanodiscus triporus]|uniref:RNA-dependent RNA polymerase n=1 Tax=Stephanodiscus triporus TaxID=2934178 RepID=A0ABD3NBF7_9STRA
MSKDDWDMLCSYGFGTIIFPRSNEGSTPLPCVIADGDLDGDDYFVMWDEKIIHHLIHSDDKLTSKARRELNKLVLPAGAKSVEKESKFAKSSDSKWLSKAQDQMLDFPRQRAATQLVGKLYGFCKDSSKRPHGSIDLFDENAIAYAKAYKDAMDVQKHGGTVNLPRHLHDKLPRSLQHLLTSKEEKSSEIRD